MTGEACTSTRLVPRQSEGLTGGCCSSGEAGVGDVTAGAGELAIGDEASLERGAGFAEILSVVPDGEELINGDGLVLCHAFESR